MKKVQENMLLEEVQTVQFFNFKLWGKHEIRKISVVPHVKERQSMDFTIEGPALKYAQRT